MMFTSSEKDKLLEKLGLTPFFYSINPIYDFIDMISKNELIYHCSDPRINNYTSPILVPYRTGDTIITYLYLDQIIELLMKNKF